MTAGYQFETHKIVTKDKYINTAWRIVGKLGEEEDPHPEEKPVVILQHGLLDNSATWLIPERSVALPFQLADLGYDVWMTNSRGNINSYEHLEPETHTVKNLGSDYYKFTYGDMAEYDVPANLDYVLKHSNFEKAFYVGHSQGTTQFFAASALYEDIKDKIAGFVGLAPVMHIDHIYDPFLYLLSLTGLENLLIFFKEFNFLIFPGYVNPLLRAFSIRFRTFFWRVLALFFGIDQQVRIDLDRMPVLANHEPGGTSVWNMKHWKQNYQSGIFAAMDWGKKENLRRYGQEKPPVYEDEKIAATFANFPSLLIAGENDALVPPKDLQRLEAIVTPSKAEISVVKDYAHCDLIWATDVNKTTFSNVIDFIQRNN